jgi:protein-L-isoaspartate(D-aspartate) O-methyltransferase
MLEQAELMPGMTVLEVGSGGLNAAYLAEIVGPHGRVVSVDIDPEITGRAATLLQQAGYGDRVRVVTADAEHGVPDEGPFDAIIVTVGAWDIAPALLDQLDDKGVLVLPLIMNGVTRTIGFRREADHLVNTSMEVAGFVPMRGDGVHQARVVLLSDGDGRYVRLSFDSDDPHEMGRLDAILQGERAERWSGVMIRSAVSFADLHLWFAWRLRGFCRVTADEGTRLAAERGWFTFGATDGAGVAYLVVRPAMEGQGVEFGARAHGPDGDRAAAAMIDQIQAWDREGRHTRPSFGYWPAGSDRSGLADDAIVMPKTHGAVSIRWP